MTTGGARAETATAPSPGGAEITGLGLVSALGFGLAEVWPRLLAGESGVQLLPRERFALPIPLPVLLGAPVPPQALQQRIQEAVPRQVWNTSAGVAHLWLLAALEALAQAGLWDGQQWNPAGPAPARVGIWVGCGGGAPGFTEQEYLNVFTAEQARLRDVSRMAIPKYMSSSLAAQLSLLIGAQGPCLTVNTACSSGATALLSALDALRLGRVDCAIAGGADLPITAATLKGFANLGALSRAQHRAACRPFDAERDGFVLGEGAGCLVLQASDAPRTAPVLARLAGGALTSEAHNLLAPAPEGAGMRHCMAEALRDAALEPRAVRLVYAHGTGTAHNDQCEAAAIGAELPGAPPVCASKAQLGHTLGAAGAIDAVLAVQSLRTGQAPPVAHLQSLAAECPIAPLRQAALPAGATEPGAAVLVNSFAFGGHNASLLITPADPRAS